MRCGFFVGGGGLEDGDRRYDLVACSYLITV